MEVQERKFGSRREGVGNKGLEKKLRKSRDKGEQNSNTISRPETQMRKKKKWQVDSHTYKKVYMNMYGLDLR